VADGSSTTGGATALSVLEKLLKRADRRRTANRPSVGVDYGAIGRGDGGVEDFHCVLRAAERQKAVNLVYGRWERSHLVERVALGDGEDACDALATFLNVDRGGVRASRAADAAARAAAGSPAWVGDFIEGCRERWARHETMWGLSPDRLDEIEERFALVAALVRGDGDGLDARTFSSRIFPAVASDASKVFERHRKQIAAMLKDETGMQGAEDDEVFAKFGLMRFAMPTFLSGPVEVDFSAIGRIGSLPGTASPWVAIHRDWLAGLRWTTDNPVVLTVENLAPFNRHVAMAAHPDVCVVYTGGFPSPAVVALLGRLRDAAPGGAAFCHWGDVDLGGIRILDCLEDALGTAIAPHLMDRATVDAHGAAAPAPVRPDARLLRKRGAVGELARRLRDTGMLLEQERVDPVAPVPA
jgi:hypothetical protein